MNLTVVLTNWKRPKQFAKLVATLRKQIEPFDLFVWDNSAKQEATGDWQIRSSRNAACSPRWWMAAQSTTPYVLIMDDDLVPTDNEVLADTVAWLEANDGQPCGIVGVQLDDSLPYHECSSVGHTKTPEPMDTDQHADILKGRYFAVATDRLANLPTKLPRFEDDIAVSGLLGGGTVLASLHGRFRDLPTGNEAVSKREGHREARERARREWVGGR